MTDRKKIVDALSDFKIARNSLIHAGADEFAHHLQAFIKQLDRNPLCQDVISSVPPFDVEAWLDQQIGEQPYGRPHLESLDLPADKLEQLAIFLYLTRGFASRDAERMSIEGFGQLFRKFKRSESIALAQSLIFRPFAEELSRRLRDAAALANPDIRDLAGVPLERIPSEGDLGIFLSHKSINKDLVRRYHKVLLELGFKPWLDEEEVVPGDVIHRVLADGMERSCAAVFFVTDSFGDEQWLGQEVNLAVSRKIQRAEKFMIITLVFGNVDIPRPLQNYVYARVENDLEGLSAIVRGIPIELGRALWKEKIVTEKKGA